MVKIKVKKICVYIVIFVSISGGMVACDYDPYKGKRPIDYDNSCWLSEGENYYIYFEVGKMEASILKMNDKEVIHFEFLWSAFDSDVNVYEYGNSGYAEKLIFVGKCKFFQNKFEIELIEKHEGYTELPDLLVFNKIE